MVVERRHPPVGSIPTFQSIFFLLFIKKCKNFNSLKIFFFIPITLTIFVSLIIKNKSYV